MTKSVVLLTCTPLNVTSSGKIWVQICGLSQKRNWGNQISLQLLEILLWGDQLLLECPERDSTKQEQEPQVLDHAIKLVFPSLLEPHGTSWNLTEPPGTFWNLLEPPETSWNLIKSPENFWKLLKTPENSWKLKPGTEKDGVFLDYDRFNVKKFHEIPVTSRSSRAF